MQKHPLLTARRAIGLALAALVALPLLAAVTFT